MIQHTMFPTRQQTQTRIFQLISETNCSAGNRQCIFKQIRGSKSAFIPN